METERIRETLERNRISFDEPLPEKLGIYLQLLVEWNKKMDLTAVCGDDEMLDRHFIDSLTVLRSEMIGQNASVIDVGTGAGFPGMVLAMARADLKVTLMDAQQKRLNFLDAVREALEIKNVCLVHKRAEEGARDSAHREQYDVAAARAVAPLNVLCEYLLPFVKTGGLALCWKGPALKNELESGRRASRILGGRLEMPIACPIEGRAWDHYILPIRKTEKTASAYPRKAGIPKAKPLGENG